ncbi:MAG: hypothetical protein C4320_05015 [Armatimonadota bacterium]
MGNLRLLLAGAAIAFPSWAAAQDPSLLNKLKRTEVYEEFTLQITEVTRTSKRAFEVRDEAPDPTADKDVVRRLVLYVKGNRARSEEMFGDLPNQAINIEIFDGNKALSYDVKKTLPGGSQLIRGSEEDKNGIGSHFWPAFNRHHDTPR